jgi:phage-related protein
MAVFGGLTPSSGSQKGIRYRTNEYQYGNGYKAIAPDGANGALQEWSINFDSLDPAKVTLLEDWLTSVPPWLPWAGDGTILPSNRTFRVTPDGYSKTALGAGAYSFSFLVEQIF